MEIVHALTHVHNGVDTQNQWNRALRCMRTLDSLNRARAWIEFSNPVKTMDTAKAIVTHSQYRELFEQCVKEVEEADDEPRITTVVLNTVQLALEKWEESKLSGMTEGNASDKTSSTATQTTPEKNSSAGDKTSATVTKETQTTPEKKAEDKTEQADIKKINDALVNLDATLRIMLLKIEESNDKEQANAKEISDVVKALKPNLESISKKLEGVANVEKAIEDFKSKTKDFAGTTETLNVLQAIQPALESISNKLERVENFEKQVEDIKVFTAFTSSELKTNYSRIGDIGNDFRSIFSKIDDKIAYYLQKLEALSPMELKAEIKATATLLDTKLTQLKSDLDNMRQAIKDNEIKELNRIINSRIDSLETTMNSKITNMKGEFNAWRNETKRKSESIDANFASLETSLRASINSDVQELHESDRMLGARINALELAVGTQSTNATGKASSTSGANGKPSSTSSATGVKPAGRKRTGNEYHPFYHDQEALSFTPSPPTSPSFARSQSGSP